MNKNFKNDFFKFLKSENFQKIIFEDTQKKIFGLIKIINKSKNFKELIEFLENPKKRKFPWDLNLIYKVREYFIEKFK